MKKLDYSLSSEEGLNSGSGPGGAAEAEGGNSAASSFKLQMQQEGARQAALALQNQIQMQQIIEEEEETKEGVNFLEGEATTAVRRGAEIRRAMKDIKKQSSDLNTEHIVKTMMIQSQRRQSSLSS